MSSNFPNALFISHNIQGLQRSNESPVSRREKRLKSGGDRCRSTGRDTCQRWRWSLSTWKGSRYTEYTYKDHPFNQV